MCIYTCVHLYVCTLPWQSTGGKMNFKKISLCNTQHTQLKYCLPSILFQRRLPPPASWLLQEAERAEADETSMLVSGPIPGGMLIPRRAPDPSLGGRLRGWVPGAELREKREPLRPFTLCTAPSKRKAVFQLGFGNVSHLIFYEAPEIWVFICNLPFFNVNNSNLFSKAL